MVWISIIHTSRVIVRKCTRKAFTMGCNLSNITCANLFPLHFISYFCNETSKITRIRHSLKTPLDSCLSVLLKLYNVCGYKTLTRFFFRGVNKLRKFLKKRGQRHIQDPVKLLRDDFFFVKIKTAWNKFCKNAPC